MELTPVSAGMESGRAGKESLFLPAATTAPSYPARAVCWMAERCVAHLFVINRYLPTSLWQSPVMDVKESFFWGELLWY